MAHARRARLVYVGVVHDASGDFAFAWLFRETTTSDRTSVIGDPLIVQVADARDMRRVAVRFRPRDRVFLRAERAEHAVSLFLDDVILDEVPLRPTLRPRFNVNVGHLLCLSLWCCVDHGPKRCDGAGLFFPLWLWLSLALLPQGRCGHRFDRFGFCSSKQSAGRTADLP